MKISGFTFIRNGVLLDYPFLESLQSLLPLCEEIFIAVGNSSDGTAERIKSLNSQKIKIIPTIWDDALRKDGAILSQQTNIALKQATGDWAIYLQADEVLHEKDYPIIYDSLNQFCDTHRVEGLLFNYKHFYGSYEYIGHSRRWYRREIRIIRPDIGISSWGDAQGFRLQGKKLQVKQINATVYHYGWVRSPEVQQLKQKSFHKLWHSDEWVKQHTSNSLEYDYSNGGKLQRFNNTHPAVMRDRISRQSWKYIYDENKIIQPFREKLLDAIEAKFGWRIGEYKNYKLI